MGDSNEKEMTFWEHLDELRKVFFRMALAVLSLACIAFIFKDFLFSIVLAPPTAGFYPLPFFQQPGSKICNALSGNRQFPGRID